jgi:hypothetical protein
MNLREARVRVLGEWSGRSLTGYYMSSVESALHFTRDFGYLTPTGKLKRIGEEKGMACVEVLYQLRRTTNSLIQVILCLV